MSTLPEAIEKALDTYMDLGTPSHPKPPRRGTKEGTKVSSRSALLNHLAAHLVERMCVPRDMGLLPALELRRVAAELAE